MQLSSIDSHLVLHHLIIITSPLANELAQQLQLP